MGLSCSCSSVLPEQYAQHAQLGALLAALVLFVQ
jgi:hypothetical protein